MILPYYSSLVVNQVSREYVARDARMAEYRQLVSNWSPKSLDTASNESPDLKTITLIHSPTLGQSRSSSLDKKKYVEHIANPSVQQPTTEIIRLDTLLGWRDPIMAYLKDGTPSNDKVEVRKL